MGFEADIRLACKFELNICLVKYLIEEANPDITESLTDEQCWDLAERVTHRMEIVIENKIGKFQNISVSEIFMDAIGEETR